MKMQEVLALFDYNEWANARWVAALDGLAAERLTAPIASSFPSILETFSHIVAAEWIWLRRWRSESPAGFPDWLAEPSLDVAKTKLAEVESDRRSLLVSLDDGDLDRVIDYKTLSGTSYRHRLGDLCAHVVNHSSYHRGQLTTMFHQVGAKPVATDLILFKRDVG